MLGPLLFVIYINDMPDLIEKFAQVSLFADDAKISRYVSNKDDSIRLQEALEILYSWSEEWLLKLNISKCKVLSITRGTAQDNAYRLNTLGGTCNLERVEKMKDLGVIVDEKLKFYDHIHERVNKAYSMLGIIKRNFKYMDKAAFLCLYKGLVRSTVEYNSSVWNPSYMGQIEEIEKVQRRATKLFRECKNLPYVERLKYLDLPTLRFRRCRGDMIETYKLLTNKYDNRNGWPSLQFSSNDRTRGNDMKLAKSHVRHDIRKHFFTHRIVNLWNSLPAQVVHASSVNDFKNKLDAHWSNQEMVYNYRVEISGTGSRSIFQ